MIQLAALVCIHSFVGLTKDVLPALWHVGGTVVGAGSEMLSVSTDVGFVQVPAPR